MGLGFHTRRPVGVWAVLYDGTNVAEVKALIDVYAEGMFEVSTHPLSVWDMPHHAGPGELIRVVRTEDGRTDMLVVRPGDVAFVFHPSGKLRVMPQEQFYVKFQERQKGS